ncbi:hypothetical protein DPEC_G00064280 [Dallia pectoralis]|uniref:Uncharacterized protein n=1 Tax=Dallia pectoralis TaxID=75939 RepID=A0ACC2H7L8_DALPE|nr:hypothetical protein DPEC_G00064280 [Dallia pectoralis]
MRLLSTAPHPFLSFTEFPVSQEENQDVCVWVSEEVEAAMDTQTEPCLSVRQSACYRAESRTEAPVDVTAVSQGINLSTHAATLRETLTLFSEEAPAPFSQAKPGISQSVNHPA